MRTFRHAVVTAAIAASAATCTPTDAGQTGPAAVGQATFFHTAFGAGPVVFTSTQGAVLEERRFEPFGAAIEPAALAVRDLNVLNRRSEVTTGWSDHGARWLAPPTARWSTPDPPVEGPAEELMEMPWELHPYQYVDQNPVVYWDPDGHRPRPTHPTRARPPFEMTKMISGHLGEKSRSSAHVGRPTFFTILRRVPRAAGIDRDALGATRLEPRRDEPHREAPIAPVGPEPVRVAPRPEVRFDPQALGDWVPPEPSDLAVERAAAMTLRRGTPTRTDIMPKHLAPRPAPAPAHDPEP